MAAILVTDDDPDTRIVVTAILKRNGYDVLAAEGGTEALRIIENGHQQLSLLLTDLIMPGLNGRDLAQRAIALRPTLKVIVMSGHQCEKVEKYLTIGKTRFALLQKPFSIRSLIHQVRGALDS
jgi:two-component system, cell cycle sensor histidine kinase and response regulator CckA